MKPLRVLNATEQVADYLRDGIMRRTWVETMPGASKLAAELGIGLQIASCALDQLEREGLLVNQGKRRKRRIVAPKGSGSGTLKVAILLYDPADRENRICTNVLLRLIEAGYQATFCIKTLSDLKMDLKKVSRYVNQVSADAWIVISGSEEVLKWFADQPFPALAIGGRHTDTEISNASVNTTKAMKVLLDRLVSLGHRRIVFLTLEDRIKPKLAVLEQCFVDELETHGIQTGSYNLPAWPYGAEGLHQCLDSLFRVTPPTAIYCMMSSMYYGVQQYFMRRGIRSPEDVSLICSHAHRGFSLCHLSVTHIDWDSRKLTRAVLNWVNQVARGDHKIKKVVIAGELIEGGTMGQAPKD